MHLAISATQERIDTGILPHLYGGGSSHISLGSKLVMFEIVESVLN